MTLEALDLKKSYFEGTKELRILNGLSFRLEQGESVAIMGPSGCGKSTLVSCLAGLIEPDAGEIILSGTKYSELSADDLTKLRSQKLGVIFQQFHLLPHFNAYENVRLPLDFVGMAESQANEITMTNLQQVHLTERRLHLPHQMSRGECQRVAIARALSQQPLFMLADEPTASLDTKTAQEIMATLLDLCEQRNIGVLIVTHDQNLARLCKKQYLFTDGTLKCLSAS